MIEDNFYIILGPPHKGTHKHVCLHTCKNTCTHTHENREKKRSEKIAIDPVPSCILVEYEGMRRDFLIIKKKTGLLSFKHVGSFCFALVFVCFT